MIREVERWRGAPEARARRGEVRKLGQFAYFDAQLDHPEWSDLRVLDFGGADGNLLWNAGCAIRHENYYCLDVVREAIEDGRRAFPRAHWAHYNHYNCSFNPEGVVNLPLPDLGIDFDVILAYSVFTHTTIENMHELVNQLRSRLTPGGALAFTFEEPEVNLEVRLRILHHQNPSLDVDALVERSRAGAWCAVVAPEDSVPALFIESTGSWSQESGECMNYDVYHTAVFMKREFPDAVIRPRVNGESAHCCIIRNS